MNTQLNPDELRQAQQLLETSDHPQADSMQGAVALLERHDGDVETSFRELWQEEVGELGTDTPEGKSLWEVTLKVLREEVCGDDSFRSKIVDYVNNPSSASLLTAAIIYLVGLTSLPINPAIATIIVLYIIKVGLNIFCEYTEPPQADKAS